jgi:hypothetical protein
MKENIDIFKENNPLTEEQIGKIEQLVKQGENNLVNI